MLKITLGDGQTVTTSKFSVEEITSAPTPVPTPIYTLPSQILDLKNWKETLPTGSASSPTEILQPGLATFKVDPWFMVFGNAVRFRASVKGVTTSGSGYPRSELREMNGINKASWSSTSGRHEMWIKQAITAVPKAKPHVVAGQIHDSNDDVLVIRLEGTNLYVNVDGTNVHILTTSYKLGTPFTIKLDVQGGKTTVYYNGEVTTDYVLNKSYSGAYFKAGCYTQSNCTKETECSDNNYGEVLIYSLKVTHS